MPGKTRSSSRTHTEEEAHQLNLDINTDLVPVSESIGEHFDKEDINIDLDESLFSITGDIDTAFRLDSVIRGKYFTVSDSEKLKFRE